MTTPLRRPAAADRLAPAPPRARQRVVAREQERVLARVRRAAQARRRARAGPLAAVKVRVAAAMPKPAFATSNATVTARAFRPISSAPTAFRARSLASERTRAFKQTCGARKVTAARSSAVAVRAARSSSTTARAAPASFLAIARMPAANCGVATDGLARSSCYASGAMAWWRGAPRPFRVRPVFVPALVLGLVACGGQSSRRDERGLGGEGGTTSVGGTAGTLGGTDGGTIGVGGTVGSGGTDCIDCPPRPCTYAGRQYAVGESFPSDDGCNTCTCTEQGIGCTTIACPDTVCDWLQSEYESAVLRAKSCNPAQSSPRCEQLYPSTIPCGCQTFVNDGAELEPFLTEWNASECPQPPCVPCDIPTDAYCSELGLCQDSFSTPGCAITLMPSTVCDYGLPCDDARDCLQGHCYIPGTRENPICSKSCSGTNPCPSGSACITLDNAGSHCFIRCTSTEFCRSINAAPENPLDCVSFEAERVCIQSSEP